MVSKENFFNHIFSDRKNPYLHITISHSALSYPLEAEMNENIFTPVLFDLIKAIYDSIRNMTKNKYIYFHLLSIPRWILVFEKHIPVYFYIKDLFSRSPTHIRILLIYLKLEIQNKIQLIKQVTLVKRTRLALNWFQMIIIR